MEKVRRFEDLAIFQSARQLCKEVYTITQEGEFQKDIRFVQQIHAAAGSIMEILLKVMNEMGTKNSSIFSILQKAHAEKSVVRLFVLLMSISSNKKQQKNFTMTVLV